MIPEPYSKQQFIDDLWFIVRRLRDMKAKADDYGVGNEVRSAQSKLAGVLGSLEAVPLIFREYQEHMVNPGDWFTCGAPEEAMQILEKKSSEGLVGLANHPEHGWAVLVTGSQPFILWAERNPLKTEALKSGRWSR